MKAQENIVIIKRTIGNSRLPKELLEGSMRALSVFSKNSRVIMPLKIEDPIGENVYQSLTNVSQGQGFREAVAKYLLDTSIDVPYDGLRLNIGLDKSGNPIEPQDYLYWKIAESHINYKTGIVKESYEAAQNDTKRCLFYIESVRDQMKAKEATIDDTASAMYQLALLFKDSKKEKIDWILTYFGESPFNMTLAEKKIRLSEIINGQATVKPVITEGKTKIEYTSKPAKVFELLCLDKDIELKAMVELMVKSKALTYVGGKYWFDDRELGMGIDEVLTSLKDESPDGKKVYMQIKARHEELKRELSISK